MGQYYNIAFGNEDGTKVTVYDRSVNGEYTMAKLMEHSWWENDCLACVARILYEEVPQRLAWIGDYAEQDDFANTFSMERKIPSGVALPNLDEVWGDRNERQGFEHEFTVNKEGYKILENPTTLDHKYFVNHEQKVYVDLDDYFKKSVDNEGWCVNPISLLTAVGNGRGGGDYCGKNEKLIGSWAWNLVDIQDEAPEGFEKLDLSFVEGR